MHDFALKAGTGDIHAHGGHVLEVQSSRHRRRCGSIITDKSTVDDPIGRDAIECPAPFIIDTIGGHSSIRMAA